MPMNEVSCRVRLRGPLQRLELHAGKLARAVLRGRGCSNAILLPDQTLETKARFIAQVMSGAQGIRSLEDVELAALSYAEVKALASGNPMVIEKAGVDAEVAKLSTLFSVWRNQRWSNESEAANLPQVIADLERRIPLRAADLAHLEPQTMGAFIVEANGRRIKGADSAAEALRAIVRDAKSSVRGISRAVERIVGRFAGFDLGVHAGLFADVPNFYLQGHFAYHAENYQQGPAIVAALLACQESVSEAFEKDKAMLGAKRKRLDDIRRELGRPFEYENRLTELLTRQRALYRLLDIDKDEAGTGTLDSEEAGQAA